MARYDEVGGDFSAEIDIYSKSIEAQREILASLVAQEIEAIQQLAEMLAA